MTIDTNSLAWKISASITHWCDYDLSGFVFNDRDIEEGAFNNFIANLFKEEKKLEESNFNEVIDQVVNDLEKQLNRDLIEWESDDKEDILRLIKYFKSTFTYEWYLTQF